MALVSLQNISIAFGGPPLLDNASLQIERGERICLLGRNGEGKSTLLKIASGEVEPSGGEIIRAREVRIAGMMQQVPRDLPGTVFDIVCEGAPEHYDKWETAQEADKVISQMGLDRDAPFGTLSGGQKRRALLARALISEPDLLILDEPTNHLDIDSIRWLENFLLRWKGTLLFVTHDRAFLRRLATRIVELDRGRLTSWDCSYGKYLERKQTLLEAEEKQNAQFDKKLAQEEIWIRKGIQARRTRNEGRVRALKKMRAERSERRERQNNANLRLQEADRSGRKVISAENVCCDWDGQPILKNFSTLLTRGDRIGIIGPNGCGKTTLLNILLGKLEPRSGKVEHGTRLEIAYFDQHRAQLDEDRSVAENIAGENDFIVFNGKRRHIYSYLEDFLFPPERARTAVRALSGGERNRLLLARLFTNPSNVLVLDEPTNDLDAETLDLLEEVLLDYSGTILLVSHDREFLNNVVTSTLVFEGDGEIGEYAGGYDDWLLQSAGKNSNPVCVPENAKPEEPVKLRTRKLSNKERQELNELPKRIEKLEAELDELHIAMNNPGFYRNPPEEIKAATGRAEEIAQELENSFDRWHELEELSAG